MKPVRGPIYLLACLLISALFVAGGCGRKGDPVAPEESPPSLEKMQDPAMESR